MAGKDSDLFLFLFFTFFLLNLLSLGQTISGDEDSRKTLHMRIRRNESKSCAEYKEKSLTLSEIDNLRELHSKIRETVLKGYEGKLPKAFYLKNLSWNEKLAELAQKEAVKCTTEKDLNLEFENQPVGQLIITSGVETDRHLSKLINKWAAGLEHLTPEIIDKYKKPKPGEFDYEPATQIIWWNTTAFGCGRSNFPKTHCNGSTTQNCPESVKLVCCYLPAGNKEGYPVYITEEDNNLICQYDDKHVHCKKIVTINDEKKKTENRKEKDSLENRIRNRMIELWPAAGIATSVKAKWLKCQLFHGFPMMKRKPREATEGQNMRRKLSKKNISVGNILFRLALSEN